MIVSDIVLNYPVLTGIVTEIPTHVKRLCKVSEFEPGSFIPGKDKLSDNVQEYQ